MSIHRVRPGASIGEVLQALTKAPGRPEGQAARRQGGAPEPYVGERDPAALRRELAALATGVDLDSEPAVRALRRPVVRRILLWEFGETFLEHPDFQGAVAAVESAMDADPAMPARFHALLKQLREDRPA